MRYLVCLVVLLSSGCAVQHTLVEPLRQPGSAPEAEPKYERRTIAGNKSPYTVMGQTYEVLPTALGYKKQGVASWYGKKFHGRPTSNGERFDMYTVSAAHKTLPIPSYVKVTNLRNNKQLLVRINDRGPFLKNRIIDLSYAAALQLGFAEQGTTNVLVEAIEFSADGRVLQPKPIESPASKPLVNTPVQLPSAAVAPTTENTVAQLSIKPEQPTVKTQKPIVGERYVQVGRYSTEAGARAVAQRLDTAFDEPIVIQRSNKGFVVAIGPLFDNVMTQKVKTLLNFEGITGAFTIQAIQ